MVLGALKDHPMSAYDINKFLAPRGTGNWVKVSEQSVYRITLRLCEHGFTRIDSSESASASKRTYAINRARPGAIPRDSSPSARPGKRCCSARTVTTSSPVGRVISKIIFMVKHPPNPTW